VVLALFVQPLALVTVYLMVTVPTTTPLTTPAVVTVAMAGVKLLQTPPLVALVKLVVLPTQTDFVPPIAAGAEGRATNITVAVFVLPPQILKVITLFPAATPVTRPVVLTVATDVVAETHGLLVAAVPDPVNWVVDPAHKVSVSVSKRKPKRSTVSILINDIEDLKKKNPNLF